MVPTVRLSSDSRPTLIDRFDMWESPILTKNCSFEGLEWKDYWSISQKQIPLGPTQKGLTFIIIAEKSSGTSFLSSGGVVSFYVTIVLVVGTWIKGFLLAPSEKIFITDMPKPDKLLLICEGILISRLEENLDREEELYYVLIDIVRSPEILKLISGSSLKEKAE